jgi:hypothetical protein
VPEAGVAAKSVTGSVKTSSVSMRAPSSRIMCFSLFLYFHAAQAIRLFRSESQQKNGIQNDNHFCTLANNRPVMFGPTMSEFTHLYKMLFCNFYTPLFI